MDWLRSSGRKTITALAGLCLALIMSGTTAAAGSGGYVETDLASDIPGRAPQTDSSLVNPWGLVRGPTTPWWTSDNGTGLSTLLKADGTRVPVPFNPVNVPMADCSGTGTPPGIVFDAGGSVNLTDCTATARHGRLMLWADDGSRLA